MPDVVAELRPGAETVLVPHGCYMIPMAERPRRAGLYRIEYEPLECRVRRVRPMCRRHLDRAGVLQRYPRLVAHVICASLGYATPTVAADIVRAYRDGEGHYCEWIAACFGGEPSRAVELAVRGRHNHRGFMAHYPRALALVREAAEGGGEPVFASWF